MRLTAGVPAAVALASPTRAVTIDVAHAACRSEFCSQFYLKLAGLSPHIHTCWDPAAVASAMQTGITGDGTGPVGGRGATCHHLLL